MKWAKHLRIFSKKMPPLPFHSLLELHYKALHHQFWMKTKILHVPNTIHPSYSWLRVIWVCWSLSQPSSGERQGYTLDRSPVHCRITYRQTTTHIFAPKGNSESSFNLAYMLLDCGGKLEHLEKTHTSTGTITHRKAPVGFWTSHCAACSKYSFIKLVLTWVNGSTALT